MIDDIVNAWKENNTVGTSTETAVCKYCQKSFRKISTLAAHQCESKRRWQQEKEVGVQFGLLSYLRFYELTQGSAKLKSYADFVTSPYYLAFVKFGRYMVEIRAVNPRMFIDWVIKENKKLDHWTHEKTYVEYLYQYLKKESMNDAFERALLEMQNYADEVKTLASFNDYFRQGNANRICHHIANGRISPWVLYNCASGIAFLESLNEGQLGLIIQWIDPDFWKNKFHSYVADTEWIKMVLKEAGL